MQHYADTVSRPHQVAGIMRFLPPLVSPTHRELPRSTCRSAGQSLATSVLTRTPPARWIARITRPARGGAACNDAAPRSGPSLSRAQHWRDNEFRPKTWFYWKPGGWLVAGSKPATGASQCEPRNPSPSFSRSPARTQAAFHRPRLFARTGPRDRRGEVAGETIVVAVTRLTEQADDPRHQQA